MAKAADITLVRTHRFMGISNVPCNHWILREAWRTTCGACGKCWRCMYELDNALNSVPLHRWHGQVAALQVYHDYRVIKSLSDGTCLYKHLVIYDILGAEPVFTD